ncbi:unnamed protein product [Calypogeia fissa]
MGADGYLGWRDARQRIIHEGATRPGGGVIQLRIIGDQCNGADGDGRRGIIGWLLIKEFTRWTSSTVGDVAEFGPWTVVRGRSVRWARDGTMEKVWLGKANGGSGQSRGLWSEGEVDGASGVKAIRWRGDGRALGRKNGDDET